MLSHSQAQRPLDLSVLQLFAKRFERRDAELFIDTNNSLGIQTRISADGREFGTRLDTQFFELSQGTGEDDLPNGAADGVTDAGVGCQIGVIAHKLIDAL